MSFYSFIGFLYVYSVVGFWMRVWIPLNYYIETGDIQDSDHAWKYAIIHSLLPIYNTRVALSGKYAIRDFIPWEE